MKTNFSKSKLSKSVALIFLLLFAVTFETGCSKKKSSSPRTYRGRGTSFTEPLKDRNGQVVQSDWGQIYETNQSTVALFLNNPSDLGTVSGTTYDSTGIRFRGNWSAERMEILVWDSYANTNGGKAYDWFLTIKGWKEEGNILSVYAVDEGNNSEEVILEGTVSNGVWSGDVWFRKPNLDDTRLGRFFISTSAFFN